MTNLLNIEEIEQTEDIMLDTIVTEINNHGTTFGFIKQEYQAYKETEFDSINNIEFEDSIVYNVFDNAYADLCYNYELIWELEQIGIFATSDLIDYIIK